MIGRELDGIISRLIEIIDWYHASPKQNIESQPFQKELEFIRRRIHEVESQIEMTSHNLESWDSRSNARFQRFSFLLSLIPTVLGIIILFYSFAKINDLQHHKYASSSNDRDTLIYINNQPMFYSMDTSSIQLGNQFPKNLNINVDVSDSNLSYKANSELLDFFMKEHDKYIDLIKQDNSILSDRILTLDEEIKKLRADSSLTNQKQIQLENSLFALSKQVSESRFQINPMGESDIYQLGILGLLALLLLK